MDNKFTQTFALLRFQLRQKWLWLSLWLLGLTAFASGYLPAFEKIAEDQGKVGLFVTMQNPAMTAIVGPLPVDVANNYTVGVMYGHEMTLFIAVVTMMIAGSFMIEQTRKTEENGQLEILKSLRIGARAYSMAAILLVLLHTILLVVLISGILVAYQVKTVDLAGSIYFASSIGLASLWGASLAYVCAQIFPTSSQARGIFFSLVGLLYLLRASTDVSNLDFSKINPLAWTYLGQPFLRNNLNYTLALLVLTMVLFFLGMRLESQRDLGASLLAARKGKTQAKGYLTTPLGFIFYLNKGTIIAWLIADVMIALMYGSIYGDIDTFVSSNELISQMFANDASSLIDSFTSLVMVVMTAIGLVMPLVVVRKVHTEEAKSRLGYLVVHRVSRGKIYLSTLFLSLMFGLLAVALNGASLGIAAVSSMKSMKVESYDFVWTCLKAAMNQCPLVWLFVGLMLLSLSLPAIFGWLVYGLLGYSFCVTYFAVLLDLPKWVVHTSLFDLLAKMPMEKFATVPFVCLSVAGIVAMLIGWWLFRNQSIEKNAILV